MAVSFCNNCDEVICVCLDPNSYGRYVIIDGKPVDEDLSSSKDEEKVEENNVDF